MPRTTYSVWISPFSVPTPTFHPPLQIQPLPLEPALQPPLQQPADDQRAGPVVGLPAHVLDAPTAHLPQQTHVLRPLERAADGVVECPGRALDAGPLLRVQHGDELLRARRCAVEHARRVQRHVHPDVHFFRAGHVRGERDGGDEAVPGGVGAEGEDGSVDGGEGRGDDGGGADGEDAARGAVGGGGERGGGVAGDGVGVVGVLAWRKGSGNGEVREEEEGEEAEEVHGWLGTATWERK